MLTEKQKVQGSPEWLALRKTRIGASDIAKIMGVSPFGSSYTLWLEKTERKQVETSPSMEAGHSHEESIRTWYEKTSGNVFFPTVIMSDDYDFAIASLDGITPDGKKILECKFCNKDVFEQAKDGFIVPHYMTQCQWQLMCAPGAEEVHYVCYSPSFDDYAVVITKRDQELISKSIKLAKVFYEEHLLKDVSPALTEQDFLCVEDQEALRISTELNDTMKAIRDLTQKQNELKKSLLEYSDDGNFICGQMKFTKTYSSIIDYKAAAIKSGIDLAPFTKNALRWTARRSNEDNKNES